MNSTGRRVIKRKKYEVCGAVYAQRRAVPLLPEAFSLSLVKQLPAPWEPLNRFKAGEIKAKTKQSAVGGDDGTLLTWQVLFSSDSSGLRKITTKESLVIIIQQLQRQQQLIPQEDGGEQVALHRDTELALSVGTLSLATKKRNLLKINWIGQRLTWQVPSWMSGEAAPRLHAGCPARWSLRKVFYKVICGSS